MVGRMYEGDYQTLKLWAKRVFLFCFSHCKSMGAIGCHGNHNFDTICSKTRFFKNIFLIFAQNIDCEYTLEAPHRGGTNECPQSMFWSKNKTIGILLRLHYVPGGHGGHVSDNREQNGITVRQRMGTG